MTRIKMFAMDVFCCFRVDFLVLIKMAVGHDFSSSTKIGNLTSLNLDLDIIRSLKGCGHLTYDGTRIKWSHAGSSITKEFR
jgi:hypothetical protein